MMYMDILDCEHLPRESLQEAVHMQCQLKMFHGARQMVLQ